MSVVLADQTSGIAARQTPMTDEQTAIEQHLRKHASRYTKDPIDDIVLIRASRRPAGRLYWYRIGAGADGRVVVKVQGNPADFARVDGTTRPRLVEPPALAVKYAREYQALDLLQQHFADLNDARFGAIPVLDRIDSARAIVMREVEGRPLKQMFAQLTRVNPRPPSNLLRHAVENAGAWLRIYHQLKLEGAAPRYARREDFIANVERYCTYLGATLSRAPFFAKLARQLESAARALFPDELELGLSHNDFATRNVLVAEDGRVSVFDTVAVTRMPVFADLAKFALATRLSRVQVYSNGFAFAESRLRTCDRWLFRGYYGSKPIPEQQIWLYAMLLLLDKWSFELALPQHRNAIVNRAARTLLNSWYTRQARAIMRRVGNEFTLSGNA